jgi:hypothetical protein
LAPSFPRNALENLYTCWKKRPRFVCLISGFTNVFLINGILVTKRSADINTDFFAEFAGHNTQQVDVVNLAAVEDYERQQQAVANAA